MANELVRARVGDQSLNVGRAFAQSKKLQVLDEPTRNPDGSLRRATRANGRPATKKKTTVDREATAKKAAVIEPAPTDEEQNR